MGCSTVLDQGPLGPRVFWAVRDHSKTNPQRPKDRLNKIGEWGVCSRECIKKGIQKTTIFAVSMNGSSPILVHCVRRHCLGAPKMVFLVLFLG